MQDSPISRAIPWNSGQFVAWVLLLFSLTLLGALRAAFALDDFAIVLWTRRFVFRHLWFAFCRRTGVAGLCSTAAADALRGLGRQRRSRTTVEYVAFVVRDLAGRSLECDWNRRSGNLRKANFDRNRICVDVQQHKRKLVGRDACPSRAQSCRQYYTDTRRGRPTASDNRSHVSRGGDYSSPDDAAANAAPTQGLDSASWR